MPSFPIPRGGVDIFYIDESAGDGCFVMASLRVPYVRADRHGAAQIVWQEHYEKATSWRRTLSRDHKIKFRNELHGSELLTSKGRLHISGKSLTKEQALATYVGAMRSLGWLPEMSLIVSAATDQTQLFGQTKMVAALTGLLQRLERHTHYNQTSAMAFFDEGHREYLIAYRKAQKYLPVGSAQGGWPNGQTVNKPLTVFTEDGNTKSSKDSYLIQIADLVAYAALQKIKAERGLLSQRRLDQGHHRLFDEIPIRVRNTRVQPARGDGIAVI